MMIKMYCIFALESVKKMNGNRGKLASMAGHAYLHSFWDSESRFPEFLYLDGSPADNYYMSEKAYKITLVVDTVDELIQIQEKYKSICGTSLVTDAGLTVFGEPTTVCLGLGPISQVDEDISNLKVFI